MVGYDNENLSMRSPIIEDQPRSTNEKKFYKKCSFWLSVLPLIALIRKPLWRDASEK